MSVSNPAPSPTGQTSGFPQYSGPGFAEIKPHNEANIRRGLRQLSLERSRRQRRYETKASKVKPGQPYLITYDFQMPRTVLGKVMLTPYLLVPNDTSLVDKPPGPAKGQTPQAWLDSLGSWWKMDPVEGPEYTLAKWQTIVGPLVFGSMVDPVLREAFLKKFQESGNVQRHITRTKLPSEEGADVDWLEVAEFLYELAAELGEAA